MPDSDVLFTTPNGMSSKANVEWEFVYSPRVPKSGDEEELYPERDGMRTGNPAWCRRPVSLEKMLERMEEQANVQLRKEGHSELIEEELVGGRLYTGPMYAK